MPTWVEQRLAHLGRLGYPVVWEPNTTAVDEYLTIKARANGAPGALRDTLALRFPTYTVRQVECG